MHGFFWQREIPGQLLRLFPLLRVKWISEGLESPPQDPASGALFGGGPVGAEEALLCRRLAPWKLGPYALQALAPSGGLSQLAGVTLIAVVSLIPLCRPSGCQSQHGAPPSPPPEMGKQDPCLSSKLKLKLRTILPSGEHCSGSPCSSTTSYTHSLEGQCFPPSFCFLVWPTSMLPMMPAPAQRGCSLGSPLLT